MFHFDRLTEEERETHHLFCRLLAVARGETDEEWKTKEHLVGYLQGSYKHLLMMEQGVDPDGTEVESLLDKMDVHWYRMDEEELSHVRLFCSLLNLTEKEKKS